jgi:hypothetical protein
MSKSPDDAKRDEVLKKMLQTKPQPRKPKPGADKNAPTKKINGK